MDWNLIFVNVPPTVAAVLALIYALKASRTAHHARNGVQKLHVEVNARLTELITSVRNESVASGHAAGVEQERVREEVKKEISEGTAG